MNQIQTLQLRCQQLSEAAGRAITEAVAPAVGAAAREDARPLSQNGYKLKPIEVAIKAASPGMSRRASLGLLR